MQKKREESFKKSTDNNVYPKPTTYDFLYNPN